MTPSGLHAPPRPEIASAIVSAGPPVTSIRLSLRSAKNATERLSGDQKGNIAFSVPASGCATGDSSGRTHSWDLPPNRAPNTIRRPSGEIAGGLLSLLKLKLAPSGGRMVAERRR